MKHIKLFEGFIGEGFHGNMGAGILPICRSTGRILIGLRSDGCNEPGTWGNFGGAIDVYEDGDDVIKEAALRELREETRYNGDIRLVKTYMFESGRFQYHNFFGLVPNEFTPRLNWEHDTAKWVTPQELVNHPKKHFGLIGLLKNAGDELWQYLGCPTPEEQEGGAYGEEETFDSDEPENECQGCGTYYNPDKEGDETYCGDCY